MKEELIVVFTIVQSEMAIPDIIIPKYLLFAPHFVENLYFASILPVQEAVRPTLPLPGAGLPALKSPFRPTMCL